MPERLIDSARLDGEALRRWYTRTPDEIERDRQAASVKRHAEFFNTSRPDRSSGTLVAAASTRPAAVAGSDNGTRYGNLYAQPPSDLAGFRRQQAEFERGRRAVAKENSWMAVPALAPVALVLGLETGAGIAARLAPKVVAREPLVLTERMPYRPVGDNWATRMGRRADKFYKDMARAKDGWTPEPRVPGPNGTTLKPDVGAPARTADPDVRRYIEVKPNTPSGRAAAARQVKKYADATKQKVRALFYDPGRFIR